MAGDAPGVSAAASADATSAHCDADAGVTTNA